MLLVILIKSILRQKREEKLNVNNGEKVREEIILPKGVEENIRKLVIDRAIIFGVMI